MNGWCKKLTLAVITLVLIAGTVVAQNVRVTGKVVDKNGEPLMGVSIMLDGTKTGTASELDGTYVIEVPSNGVLVFSAIGMETKKENVNGRKVINVTLGESTVILDELVVTALGIKKERKALGYAVQDLKSDEILKNKQTNVINSLNGKIAGVNITNSSGAPGASASIIIRGGTSLERDNQPLFVIDGIPVDNSTDGGASAFDGSQGISVGSANRAMDINPEDIESVSVLKGPAAAALYGIRAAAGAIVITTKKGKEGVVTASFNGRYVANWVNKYPEQQTIYKRGSYYSGAFQNKTFGSWGDKLTASDATYNNMKDFFDVAGAYELNFNISSGNKNGNFYLSASRIDQNGVVPTTGYARNSFRFNGEQKYGKFTFGATAAYSQSKTSKALTGSGLWGSGGSGTMQTTFSWPSDDNMSDWLLDDGTMRGVIPGVPSKDNVMNPYWQLNRNPVTDNTDRLIASVYSNINVTSWFDINYKLGMDTYKSEYTTLIAPGSALDEKMEQGMIAIRNTNYEFIQSNLMLNFHKSFLNDELDFALILGQAVDAYEWNTTGIKSMQFVIPSFFSPDNANKENKEFYRDITKKRLVGVYGDFRVSYKRMLFLGVTGRNDWSSTLPVENRSFFYPSYSASFVFTELMKKNSILSFGKVRASYATVGKDAPAYNTRTYLFGPETTIGGGFRNSWTGGNPYLKPEKTTSFEAGFEAKFLNGALGVDFTYYTNKSVDQILQPRVSNGTGYILRYVNTGTIENKGYEIQLTASPIMKKDFRWDIALNMSHNKGKVYDLPVGLDILYVTSVQLGNAKPASFNNGIFMGLTGQKWNYVTDKESPHYGKTILDWNTGLPRTNTDLTKEVGNREPKLLGGLNNTIAYKDFQFNVLLDFRVGGDIYNGTLYDMTANGMSKLTENREGNISLYGVAVNPATGEYEDVVKDVAANEKFYKDYYLKHTPNFISKDVNWLRLRSVSLTYSLPKKLMDKIKFMREASVTVSGTNLFYITNYDGMDPEVAAGGAGTIGSGSAGFDYCGVPSVAGFSVALNLKF